MDTRRSKLQLHAAPSCGNHWGTLDAVKLHLVQCQVADIELRLDLCINAQCPGKHQRSIQVIPEPNRTREPQQMAMMRASLIAAGAPFA